MPKPTLARIGVVEHFMSIRPRASDTAFCSNCARASPRTTTYLTLPRRRFSASTRPRERGGTSGLHDSDSPLASHGAEDKVDLRLRAWAVALVRQLSGTGCHRSPVVAD